MTKKDGREYEALTEQVFRRLLAQRDIGVEVSRDVTIAGRSTDHQIDVYFAFRLGGIEYQTIVQCKDWQSPVKQEQVLALHAVLQDIPGQPRGIIVARSGFQKGARRIAEHHGIQLYELRAPQDEDWDGLIREVRIVLTFLVPEYRGLDFHMDQSWFDREMQRLGIAPSGKRYDLTTPTQSLYAPSGEAIDVQSVLAQVGPHQACDWTSFDHAFPTPLDIDVVGLPVARVRTLGIRGEVKIEADVRPLSVRVDHLVAYCFRDVLVGTREFLDKHGKHLRDRGPDE